MLLSKPWGSQRVNKVTGQAYNFIKKEILAQVFSCEFYEISKNIYFYKTIPVAASVHWKWISNCTAFSSVKTCIQWESFPN